MLHKVGQGYYHVLLLCLFSVLSLFRSLSHFLRRKKGKGGSVYAGESCVFCYNFFYISILVLYQMEPDGNKRRPYFYYPSVNMVHQERVSEWFHTYEAYCIFN